MIGLCLLLSEHGCITTCFHIPLYHNAQDIKALKFRSTFCIFGHFWIHYQTGEGSI